MCKRAGEAKKEDKGCGAAGHVRHCVGRQVGVQIVETETGQCRHQVFNRGHAHIALLQHERHARIANRRRLSEQINHLRQVDAVKNNTGIGLRGAQGQLDTPSRVDADACRADEILNSALSKHNWCFFDQPVSVQPQRN